MGDLKKRASFAKLVNYVNNPKKRDLSTTRMCILMATQPLQEVCKDRLMTSRGAG